MLSLIEFLSFHLLFLCKVICSTSLLSTFMSFLPFNPEILKGLNEKRSSLLFFVKVNYFKNIYFLKNLLYFLLVT